MNAHLLESVRAELRRAKVKFPLWPTDPLHALAILGEEFGELNKSVLEHAYEPRKSSLEDVRVEAIQTAAMALRFLESLDDYEYQRSSSHTQSVPNFANHKEL